MRWSPDGSQLLFTSQQAGSYDIWIMDADGSGQRALTTHPADDENPDWSPDGELTGHEPLGYPAFAPASVD